MGPSLQVFLDRLHDDFHRPEYLSSDPLEFVHRYQDPWDQEAVALLAALLAYGNVKQIRRSVQEALDRMLRVAAGPKEFARGFGTPGFSTQARQAFRGYVHRFNSGSDLVTLFALLSESWERHGSLGAHFLAHLEPEATDIGSALDGLISEWRSWAVRLKPGPSFSYLLTAPGDGSCCKRWCMLLRWMGRTEKQAGLDLGLWASGSRLAAGFPNGRALRSEQLILPLDTHTGRISQYLGLTRRKTLNWKAALEITDNLKHCNRGDPTRYDFALSRLGILDLCQRKYRPEICSRCQLLSVCRFALRRRTQNKKKAAH